MSVDVVTFGCRLNASEAGAILARAREARLADAVVVNTCAVTEEAVRQSRQAIRRLRRERPGARIIVTGCAAQVAPATYAGMEEVDLVLGNAEKLRAENYREAGVRVGDIFALREDPVSPAEPPGGKVLPRAFLAVQNGCDHRCTFCVIPFGRGNSRSRPMGAVVAEARALAEKGHGEIVLTGVDLTAYGADLPGSPMLGDLVRKILSLAPEVKRLRLSSIDSIEADPSLMRAIAEEARLMPHFHLSAQSGDDLILKRMKRRHSRRDTIEFCNRVRRLRPDAAFGADLIAGFPTESEAMFENTLALVGEAGFSYLHVFAFSPRGGTPAARMPQIPRAAIRDRARRLRAAGAAALAARLATLAGRPAELLVEKPGHGRTECFAYVRFGGEAPTGAIVAAHLREARSDHLTADLAR